MDNAPDSPVLLQHSSLRHTLGPHPNLQTQSFSFLPLPDPPTIPRLQQRVLTEIQTTTLAMEEARTLTVPSNGQEMPDAAADDLASRVTQDMPEGESPSRLLEPSLPTTDSVVDMPINTNNATQSAEEAVRQTLSAPGRQAGMDIVGRESDNLTTNPDLLAPSVIEEPEIVVPEWVIYEEDKSEITKEELSKIEGTVSDVSALDVLHHEKKIYVDLDDPEQRPIKKLRLSWTIKGVRGTRQQPNYARVMNSPAAYVDGFYWYIKFFPRGNNSSHLSSYIRCTPIPPIPDSDVPENTFKVFQGAPDADLGDTEPIVELSIPATPPRKKEPMSSATPLDAEAESQKGAPGIPAEITNASAVTLRTTENTVKTTEPETDWRISAQLGTVIYNPAEPRSGYFMRSEHQFNKHNDDWGWTNFHGPWNTIHIREKDQRKPLLQNDTLTIDAYIRIFEDPTQALWWHQAGGHEVQWDSKSLTGYFPFGTPPLYHSPGVAGLASLLLLKPFRDILQGVDTGRWKDNTRVKPQPLITHLQVVLFLMRNMKKEELYVNLNPVLEVLESSGEAFSTVREFWEVLRRSIELELEDDVKALRRIADMFDGADVQHTCPFTLAQSLEILVEGIEDIQSGIDSALAQGPRGVAKWIFPKFLTIDLNRQRFDSSTREWKVLHDRVKLNDKINISRWSSEELVTDYVLYGFAVHVGERASGRAYSVLRPGGPGTKWLAFEDGVGNKIYSYTKKRVQDFEGVEDTYSFLSTRQTAYLAMYIRADCMKDFLPGTLEPYAGPSLDWIKAHLATLGTACTGESRPRGTDAEDNTKKDIAVEVYEAAKLKGRRGLLDMYNLRDTSQPIQKYSLPATTTYKKLRRIIADSMWIDNVETIRFWAMQYGALGEYVMTTMPGPALGFPLSARRDGNKPLCLWLEVLQTEADVELYGCPDPPDRERLKNDQGGLDGYPFHDSVEPLADIQAAFDLLFPESQNGSAGGTPSATGNTISSDGIDDQSERTTPPHQVQDSAPEAANSTMANVPNLTAVVDHSALTFEPGSTDVLADVDFDDFLNVSPDISLHPITARESASNATPRPNSTENGHMLDSLTAGHQLPSDAAMVVGEQDAYVAVEVDNDNAADAVAAAAADAEVVERPWPHVYVFLQRFDVEQQDFVVHSTFLARHSTKVKVAVGEALGFGYDHDFCVWHRGKSCRLSTVNNFSTFYDVRGDDGVDLVVGENLSETTKERLLGEGKFVTPDSLSTYLLMRQRRHPVKAFTGTMILNSFGSDYYSGPLLNGRYHGDNGTHINSIGHRYSGPFVSGVRQGPLAQLTYQNGDIYNGSFHANERHGQGTFIQKRTGNRYVGGYQNDKRWGKGTMHYEVADEEGEMCQICYGEEMDALFYECGHICACVGCARQVDACPICRQTVKEVVRVYRA